MNLVFGIIAIIVCVYFGYLLSDKFVKRKNFFYSFKIFNEKIETQIGFSNKSLLKIIDDTPIKDDFFHLITSIVKNIDDVNLKYVKKDEIDFIKGYIAQIMNTDQRTLKDLLHNYSSKITDKYETAVIDKKKYRSLYIKLSFLIGLVVLIILL